MTDFRSEAEFWRFMTSIMPSEHQEMMHLQEGVWCQNEHANNTEQFIQPEIRSTRNMPPESKTTQLESITTSLPRIEGEDATYTVEEAWSNLRQAEDYLTRGIIAFLPRIEKEEANPTFEHPENWNRLNLQEKANLIILDNIIKLACMGGSGDDNVKEIQALYASTPPSLLGRGLNTVQVERGHNPNKKQNSHT